MIVATPPQNEEERLQALRELGILDTLEEQSYDDLTRLAAEICGVPIALVSLVDQDRQWFKSHHGLAARETPRAVAFCSHAILGDDIMVVEDSSKDERFHDNPLATDAPHVVFYAGAPLILRGDVHLGTLCVIDTQPRTLSEAQRLSLAALARQVVTLLDLRLRNQELQTLDRAKDDFIAMISHELRTPLTSICGSLALLSNTPATAMTDERRARLTDISQRNAERLVHLVEDVLDAATLDAGKLELELERVDLKALAARAVELNQPFAEVCDTTLQLGECALDSCLVEGDEARLQQVIGNLISNAAKFTVAKDTILVGVEDTGASLRLTVTDHGPGVPPEIRTRLFERFARLNQDQRQHLPGTGLGLNIAKKIVELHGGSIGLSSDPGVRTCFYFDLPRAAAD